MDSVGGSSRLGAIVSELSGKANPSSLKTPVSVLEQTGSHHSRRSPRKQARPHQKIMSSHAADPSSLESRDTVHVAQPPLALDSPNEHMPTAPGASNEDHNIHWNMVMSYGSSLSILRENLAHSHYSLASYMQIIDSITAIGLPLPSTEVINILVDLLKSDCFYFIDKVSNFLHRCRTPLLNRETLLNKEKSLLEIIETSLKVLESALSSHLTKTPGCLAAKAVLEFTLNVFVEDIKANDESSLLQVVLSLMPKWTWMNKFLDNVFLVSKLELNIPGNDSLLECHDVLLNLALLPLVTCKSKVEEDDLSISVAKEISLRIDQLPTTFKKCFFLWRIPSDEICVKVIDIHLDTHFTFYGDSTPARGQPFSLLKYKDVHLCRSPVDFDGTRHDLGYLLNMLTLLLQSYIFTLTGTPLLSFLPGKAMNLSSEDVRLNDVHMSVLMFIDRLSTDADISADLIKNWQYLELLLTMTS